MNKKVMGGNAKMALVVRTIIVSFPSCFLDMRFISKNQVGELCILNYHRGKSKIKLSNRSRCAKLYKVRRERNDFCHTSPAPFLFRYHG